MKAWKRMLVICLATVQFAVIIPVAAAEQTNQPPTEQTQAESLTTDTEQSLAQKAADKKVAVKKSPADLLREQMMLFDYSVHGKDVLVLIANSPLMFHNGFEYQATQPMTVEKGVTYIALRSLVDRIGFKLSKDPKTKETIVSNGQTEVRYKTGSSYYRLNGKAVKMSGKPIVKKGTFMVPILPALTALQIPYTLDPANKRTIVRLDSPPVAKFSVNEQKIYAGQTRVSITNDSYSLRGHQIVEEEWVGLQEYYEQPGSYTISLKVMDVQGEWSQAHSETITVLPPNEAPTAQFNTDKDTYKMGELIRYQNYSSDPENDLKSEEWTNKQPAFFTAGPKTIKLKVTDGFGASHEVEQTITITEETKYTANEFNIAHTEVGEVYPVTGSILAMELLKPESTSAPRVLLRSNSPESVKEEGVLYADKVTGGARILMHHQNESDKNLKVYVTLKNVSDTPASVKVERAGWAGPSNAPQQTGKMALVRYFDSHSQQANEQSVVLQPGESRVFLKEMSDRAMKKSEVYTLYADFYADTTVEYSIIALDEKKDIIKELPNIKILHSDGVHIRGTFIDADRNFNVKELLGEKHSRLLFADGEQDPNVTGNDMIDTIFNVNKGNKGVLYRVTLDRVAPNTLISFNSRSGTYAGALLVNGITVHTPNNGLLKSTDDASVVYRTGNNEERLEIWFVPASGSNLPVNLIFTPVPKPRS
ncbi:copper amine oxidase N-terminal domain-containing protein [Paenibacillus sp. 481]|uniref:copper amine oxidase N-terminal domain-containing protein n=1 Tax=Paenibacillus sp. 481 TaxID=2835869 RepID=UPI001E3D3F77|nr:copper amine oxidase N-terminal domain-containing protein [Paenibacillus sp. 481]UHA72848.1 copper amine oxidase N-terminal domain-containing protein [Paenibacillus sp. 481]